ncbi:sulfurtransferase [Panacagrimonas sp.]|uniref:sulfurtransferase n=1 Tax=Panacagrimonas sp. TaxID=2480088 RepID=UPI003B522D4B
MEYAHPEYLVETHWLQEHLDDPGLRVVDCTHYLPNYFDESAARYIEKLSGRQNHQNGHIPGSVFVDLRDDLCDPSNDRFMYPMCSAAQFASTMSRLGIGPDTRVVLYDDMLNIWAARVWWMLRSFGFERAAVLNGGWKKWVAEGRPVTTTMSTPLPAQFVCRPRAGLIADQVEVLAAIDRGDTCLVHSLDPDEYAGRGAVRYQRPGHIPSSVNVSFLGLVDPDTQAYLPADRLHEQFERVGALAADRVITYCGGAIAACSTAFAMTLLGVKNIGVYDGSMTEWAADLNLPLVVGEAAR